jgi:regulator of cell morphogenesis and NO signaling
MTTNTLSKLSAEKSVGEWVAADYRAAAVFNKYGIDFCCGGQKRVTQACTEKGIDPEVVIQEVEHVTQTPGIAEQYDQWALDFLADYIVNQFHVYTKNRLPLISDYMETVAAVHGESHPETRAIAALWQAVKGELAMHMQKEELLLFPYIKRLVRSEAEGGSPTPPPFGSARELIQTMEAEHEQTGDALGEMERLSLGYTPPEEACPTYRTLYAYLNEFDAATKKHIHLENNILFPKTIKLEEQLSIP